MQFHFCLDLSDPLILRGTLFPCDVKTPGLKILFLLSFQELKTLFRAEPDTHRPWWRRIIAQVIALAYKSTEEIFHFLFLLRSWVTDSS